MKRIAVLVSLFLFGIVSVVSAGTRDFQYWKAEAISWRIAKDWKLSLTEEIYFKNNAADFYYQHTELGASYSGMAKWLEVGLNFRHALNETKSLWKKEEQPSFQGILKWTVKGFNISDRNRFEYRIKEDADDYWRYRNQFSIKAPWKWTRFEIQPYFTDEFFVDFDIKELNENRLQPGFSIKITKEVAVDIFYMWRRVKSGNKWATNDILGTRLKLSF